MTKKNLVDEVATQTGLNKEDVLIVLEATNRTIRYQVAHGESIFIRGFGTYKPVLKNRTVGRNIKAGTTLEIPPRYVPVFKPVSGFKSYVDKTNRLLDLPI